MKTKLPYVDPIKGILCLWIVLYHYTTRYYEIMDILCPFPFSWTNGAKVGVPLFFFISGFLTEYSWLGQESAITIKWLFKKLLRLYPLFVISIIIVSIILLIFPNSRMPISFGTIARNFLLAPIIGYKYVDGAHWYLFALLKFYIIYFIQNKIVKTKHQQIVVYFLILATCTYAELSGFRILRMITLSGALLYLYLGCSVAHMFRTGASFVDYVVLIGYAFVAAIYCNSWWFIFYLVLFVWLNKQNSYPCGSMGGAFRFLGSISFAWYLIHQYVGYTVIYQLQNVSCLNDYLILASAIVLTLLIAYFLALIDKKISLYLSGFFK